MCKLYILLKFRFQNIANTHISSKSSEVGLEHSEESTKEILGLLRSVSPVLSPVLSTQLVFNKYL